MFGAVVFFAFVLLATHTLIGLYATSTATAMAWDAARSVASNSDDPAVADARLRSELSGFEGVTTDWARENEQVGVHVVAQRPSILPDGLANATNLTKIDRWFWVREETLR